jgi:hypothetical protein
MAGWTAWQISAIHKSRCTRYLQVTRDDLVWKLDGLSEREARLPRTATGNNLLGVLKHCLNVEAGYFGPTFGRQLPRSEALVPMEAYEEDPQADWYASGPSDAYLAFPGCTGSPGDSAVITWSPELRDRSEGSMPPPGHPCRSHRHIPSSPWSLLSSILTKGSTQGTSDQHLSEPSDHDPSDGSRKLDNCMITGNCMITSGGPGRYRSIARAFRAAETARNTPTRPAIPPATCHTG